jgi:hypothetical protein
MAGFHRWYALSGSLQQAKQIATMSIVSGAIVVQRCNPANPARQDDYNRRNGAIAKSHC